MPFQKSNKLGKKFQPGHSLNPGGRPKKLLTNYAIARLVAEDHKLAKAVARSWLSMARRNPGKISQPLDGDVEIQVNIKRVE